MPGSKFNRTRETAANVLVASFFAFFAYAYALQLLAAFRMSLLLMVIKETLDVGFYLCRRFPTQVSSRTGPWVTAICGTLTPLLLRPSTPSDSTFGKTIQVTGLLLQVASVASLNRSFGIVPAVRGIKKQGMYSLVRHPLYSAYTITILGFVINNVCAWNVLLFIVATIFQLLRISNEEELLLQSQEYIEYAKYTKWKMAPFIY